jgi:8-oxo-dGTP diphosphatase
MSVKWQDQGLERPARYTVIPRTLVFLTWGEELLLLRGAPTKKLWANKLNGLGGHIEPDEDVLDGALREVREETGLEVRQLALRGLVHVAGREGHPGVLLCVFVGQAPSKQVRPSAEGCLEWFPLASLPYDEMVEDLPLLIPRVLGGALAGAMAAGHQPPVVLGHYATDDRDEMRFAFRTLDEP